MASAPRDHPQRSRGCGVVARDRRAPRAARRRLPIARVRTGAGAARRANRAWRRRSGQRATTRCAIVSVARRSEARRPLRGAIAVANARRGMAAILTLALGIGTTTAVFTLFDSVLLKPLAVDRPDELRAVRQAVLFGGRIAKSSTYLPLRVLPRSCGSQPEAFSEVVAFADLDDAVLTANGRETRLPAGGVFVSDNYFSGARRPRAVMGRTVRPGGSRRSIGRRARVTRAGCASSAATRTRSAGRSASTAPHSPSPASRRRHSSA